MTKEAQRNAIANACGLTKEPDADMWRNPHGIRVGAHHIPDYPKDLNAMHQAEDLLHFNAIGDYIEHLGKIVRAYWLENGKDVERFDTQSVIYAHAHATAAQRAEAFLRTLGLWRDDA